MEKVTGILANKQLHFKKISPHCSISDALCRMSSQHTEYLIVIDDNEKFLGLLTEHDIASKSIFTNLPLSRIKVKEMMNTRLPIADVNDTVETCMKLMKQFRVHYVPVFDELEFIGVVSTDDILEAAVSNGAGIFD